MYIDIQPQGHTRTEEAMLAALHDAQVIDNLRREAKRILSGEQVHETLRSTALRFLKQHGGMQ